MTAIDKNKLTTDPATLKSLIDERLALRATHEGTRETATKAIQAVDDELKMLQEQAEYVFGVKEKPPKVIRRDPISGERLKDNGK